MHCAGKSTGNSGRENNTGLGRRVPSLTDLHDNLEDMVGASLALAIEELSVDAGGKINQSTEDSLRQVLRGETTEPAHPNVPMTGGGLSFEPETHSPEGGPTFEMLLKFAQVDVSRALILLNVESVAVEYLVGKCLEYGALKYFETEFQSTFGVVFLAFYDLRAAEAAVLGLKLLFQSTPVAVHYCVSLDAAVSPKEHTLVVRHVPSTISDDHLRSTFASFGPLRSLQKDLSSEASQGIYTIDYFSSEHAKQAAFSMTTSLAWGSGVQIDFARQSEHEERSSRQLFALLLHWRRELHERVGSSLPSPLSSPADSPQQQPMYVSRPTPSPMGLAGNPMALHNGHGYYSPVAPSYDVRGHGGSVYGGRPQQTRQCHYVGGGGSSGGESTFASFADAPSLSYSVVPPNRGKFYGGVGKQQQQQQQQQQPFRHGGGRKPSRDSGSDSGPTDDVGEFGLNLDHVLKGFDRRSTLMIRNIPNKYSQTAILEEINEQFVGSYDFFYLPIDFKNKCNVGYAFINFCDPTSIAPFFCKYNGRRWTHFNSEKVCAISYARIQGKASMVSRFQNSSVMEKDGEYRPLLFQSTGPNRGLPEPFPVPNPAKSKHAGRGAV